MRTDKLLKLLCFILTVCILMSAAGVASAEEQDTELPISEDIGSAGESEEEAAPEEEYTVRFLSVDGSTELNSVSLPGGSALSGIPTSEDGMKICGWLDEDGKPAELSEYTVSGDVSFRVAAEICLNTEEHIKYINGYPEGCFLPEEAASRADIAQMLSSLIVVRGEGTGATEFTDVTADHWAYNAIYRLTSVGVLIGYEDGSFRPDAPVTRAEFVALLSRLFIISGGSADFSDVPADAWYEAELAFAVSSSWIYGYGDGLFGPEDPLTRAQAVSIINRAAGRSCDKELLKTCYADRTPYFDVLPEYWAFDNIIEASVAHDYTKNSGGETWKNSELTVDRTEGLVSVNGSHYCVDGDGLYTVFGAGFYAIDNRCCYSPERGTSLILLSGGMNVFNGELYYVRPDGSLAENESLGRLYFGADGRYTSGNAELDAHVKGLLASCTDSSMSREQMLRAAYLYLRDSGRFGYVGGPHYGRGTDDWTEKEALTFFTPFSPTKSGGNCYSWAAALMYTARQLGYDAYAVSGGVPSGNSDHAWVMIPWDDGNEYLFDIELEWGHMHGYYIGQNQYDLYKLMPDNTPFPYYFPEA